MILKNTKIRKKGFTLVELLAVIVILAIILVIAVPKVVNIIEDTKKATLESTAKMIASQAEKQKVQNTVLGNTETITCENVAKMNDIDYAYCYVIFDNNIAKVTIAGSGKFEGLYVCNGTKTDAVATYEECQLIPYGDGDSYINELLTLEDKLHNGLVQTTATYTNADGEEITLNAGIRYIGTVDTVKNLVYFNCEDKDANDIEYGDEGYEYDNNCEIWRIIGVFETEDENGDKAPRIKIINTNSTFTASWDSSEYSSSNNVNNGRGVNQWSSSKLINGTTYPGADLFQLLDGYYIGKTGSKCKYNNSMSRKALMRTCDTTAEPLSSLNMKPLTSTAKEFINKAVWYTYASMLGDAENLYLQEIGISHKYTGCGITETTNCTIDNVIRKNIWVGLVGLMSASDIMYADGWLNSSTGAWSITAFGMSETMPYYVYYSLEPEGLEYRSAYLAKEVWPAVYLSSDVQIVGGNGGTKPYKLAM